ncbi:hypothetical protein QEN58_16140 [Halomonas alkaliantarctica]|uniref:Uncharacterized protein n=1 Tax=Halomonas alkaliantarctica TaxID=232346 RepID=A0ABY8LSJ1_9GAMM|nr:hypothetical protein [Halomonas alkaliantarctica]WGI27388.1 hypothetical protein QEN58_16140 [Halomonas alkaliantarctica]
MSLWPSSTLLSEWGYGGAIFLTLALVIKAHYHFKFREAVPTRFHRQRREVAFAPGGGKPAIIVPWEDVVSVCGFNPNLGPGAVTGFGYNFGLLPPDPQRPGCTLPGAGIMVSVGGLPGALAQWAKPSAVVNELSEHLRAAYQRGEKFVEMGDIEKRFGVAAPSAEQAPYPSFPFRAKAERA